MTDPYAHHPDCGCFGCTTLPVVVNPQAVGDPTQTPIVRLRPASQPPDLRTLAAEAILAADPQLLDLYDNRRERYLGWADAVLAAVLPTHRQQVLDEAAEAIKQIYEDAGSLVCAWTTGEVLAPIRDLATDGPEAASSATLPAQQGEVESRDAPEAHSGYQGDEWDRLVNVVCERLTFAQTEPYGDLAMNADRAAVIAVQALREKYVCEHDLEAFQRQATELATLRADLERVTRERDEALASAKTMAAAADRFQRGLTSLIDERDTLRTERVEADALKNRMGDLLTGVANAIKGNPGPLTMHDWSDLPARAAQLRATSDAWRREATELADTVRRVRELADRWIQKAEPDEFSALIAGREIRTALGDAGQVPTAEPAESEGDSDG